MCQATDFRDFEKPVYRKIENINSDYVVSVLGHWIFEIFFFQRQCADSMEALTVVLSAQVTK